MSGFCLNEPPSVLQHRRRHFFAMLSRSRPCSYFQNAEVFDTIRRGEARKGRSLRHGFRRGARGKAEAESPERSGGRRRERGTARCAPSEGAGAVAWGSRQAGPANMEMPWTFEDALGSSFPPSPRAPVLGERPGRDIAGSFCGLGVLPAPPPPPVLAEPVSRCATISAREIGGEQRRAL